MKSSQTAIRAWLMLGLLAYVALPWYAQQDSAWYLVLPQVTGGADTANGLVQALLHGRKWLLLGLAGLLLAMAGLSQPPGRDQGRWLLAGGLLGSVGLLVSGFAIGAQGWSFAVLSALWGELPQGQFGMGAGGMLALTSLVMLASFGAARRGAFRGDLTVSASVVGCAVLLALFIAYPLTRALAGAFLDEDQRVSWQALWDRVGHERVWGLGCMAGGVRCGVAWNTLWLGLATALGTTLMGTVLALMAERASGTGHAHRPAQKSPPTPSVVRAFQWRGVSARAQAGAAHKACPLVELFADQLGEIAARVRGHHRHAQVGQLGAGLGFQAFLLLARITRLTQLVKFIAIERLLRLRGRPGVPAGLRACRVLQLDAVDRTHRDAQLAAGAGRLDHGVHAFVAADDGVGGAGLDAQGAADAPGLVDHGHRAWAFGAVRGVQCQDRSAGEGGQALYPLRTAWRAAVDRGLFVGDGLCVGGAVGVAAARALRLRQRRMQAGGQRAHSVGVAASAVRGARAGLPLSWCLRMNSRTSG